MVLSVMWGTRRAMEMVKRLPLWNEAARDSQHLEVRLCRNILFSTRGRKGYLFLLHFGVPFATENSFLRMPRTPQVMRTEPRLLPGVLPGAALAGSKFWASEPAQNWAQLLKIAQLCSLCFPAWKGHRLFLVPPEPGLGVGGKIAMLGQLQSLFSPCPSTTACPVGEETNLTTPDFALPT